MFFSASTATAVLAGLLATQTSAAAISRRADGPSGVLTARSVPTTAQCEGQWETVTNDPVVQWWWISVPNVAVDHDAFWNHMNLNDCAPTANEVKDSPTIKGVAIKFHASEPCTHTAIEHAFRSASHPPTNIGCDGPGSKDDDTSDGGAEGLEAALEGILEGLGGGDA